MLVLAAIYLRARYVASIPPLTDDAGELAFAWAGLSLITKGVPYSWSYFHAYGHHVLLFTNGTTYPIVHPWFDHPPLFALIEGFAAWLGGARSLETVTAIPIRLPGILLNGLTVGLTMALGRRVVGRWPAVLGAALLALSPITVLTSRVAESEVLLAPLLLIGLLAVHRIVSGQGGRWALTALLLVSLAAPLAKVPGVAVGGICAVVLIASGRWRQGLAVMGAAAAGLAAFAIYGAILDWQLFLAVFKDQAGRRSGILAAFNLITASAGINRQLTDGWWLLGWVGIGLLLRDRAGPAAKLLALPAAGYLAVMLVMADQDAVAKYGWYRETIVPELYLAAGALVWEVLRGPSAALLALVMVTGGATATNFWLGTPWAPGTLVLIAIFVVALTPSAIAALRPASSRWNFAARVIAALVVVALMYGNLNQSYRIENIFNRL